MRNFFRQREVSFSIVLPLLSIANWTVLVAVPSILFLLRFRSAPSFEPRPVQIGGGTVFLPPLTPLSFALNGVAASSHRFIVVLDAPAMILNIPIALIFNNGELNMASIDRNGWESLTFPFLAIRAWIFVGIGCHAFAGRTRLKAWHPALSLILAAISVSFYLGLQFGSLASEREGRIQLFIAGFALWAILFALPAAAWFRAKSRRQRDSSDTTL